MKSAFGDSSEKTANLQKKRRLFLFDGSLLVIIILLLSFGLLAIYSASSYTDFYEHAGNGFYTTFRQFVFVLLSLPILFVFTNIDYHKLIAWGKYLYPLAVILGITVLFFGHEVNGQKRWFSIGPVSFQPAEFAKIVLILNLTRLLKRWQKNNSSWKIILFTIAVSLPIFLPVVSANLSSGIIIAGIAFFMVYAGGRKRPVLSFLIAFVVAGIVLLLSSGILEHVLEGYQMDRILAWKDPTLFPSTTGFQTLQGLYAIGAGGLFGSGYGSSLQKLGFLPEAQNDMIFSIICEEWGFVGSSLLISLFVLLLWRILVIALSAKDMEGMLVTFGILVHIGIQLLLNICVVTNTIPNTGISLPFISYGGSSLFFLMIEIGIIQNVSRFENEKH